jgi:hypothetical protein
MVKKSTIFDKDLSAMNSNTWSAYLLTKIQITFITSYNDIVLASKTL